METIKFKLRNDISEVSRLHRLLEDFADSAGLGRNDLNSINLAIEELFANVVNYGYPHDGTHWVDVRISIEDGHVAIRIVDDGVPFNPVVKGVPDTGCPVEKRRVGGLGIHLCRNLMDDITYERDGPRNIVTLKKRLKG